MSQALQATLAGEYATMYAYGRAGGRLLTDQDAALVTLELHRRARDQLRQWLEDDGDDLQPPAPAYELPGPVTTDGQARELLSTVELRLIPLFTEMIADQADSLKRRRWAIRQVRECALRAQFWGAAGQAFPWPADLPPPA